MAREALDRPELRTAVDARCATVARARRTRTSSALRHVDVRSGAAVPITGSKAKLYATIMKRTTRLGIRSRLLLWLGGVTLPILAASMTTVQIVDARLSERIEKDLMNVRRLEAARIDGALANYRREARTIASGRHLDERVLWAAGSERGGGERLASLANALRYRAATLGSGIVEVDVRDVRGLSLGASSGFGWKPYDAAIVQRAIASGETLFGNAFRPPGAEPRLGVVAPIPGADGAPVGALVLEMRLAPIVDPVIEHEGFGATSEAHIAQPTPAGDAEFITPMRFAKGAAFSKVVPAAKDLPINRSLDSPGGRLVRAKDYRGTESVLALETLPDTGWGLVVKIDAAEAFAPVAEVRRYVILAGLISAAVVLLGWFGFLHPLAGRLRRVAHAAERVARGELDRRTDDASGDEIGGIARSIDALARDLAVDRGERALAEERLVVQATHDELTGLLNRKRGNALIGELEADASGPVSMLFLDLDGFKAVNDTAGHAAGDEVLVSVALRVGAALGASSTLVRWGGDEFLVVVAGADAAAAEAVRRRVAATFDAPVTTAFGAFAVGCSIGVATSPDGTGLEALLHDADVRMYALKGEGGRSARGGHSRGARADADALLADALDEDRVEAWFQPIVTCDPHGGTRLVGAEALARVRARDGSVLVPAAFLHADLDADLARALDLAVGRRAIGALARWHLAGSASADFTLSFNLGSASLGCRRTIDALLETRARLAPPPGTVCVEINERADPLDARTLASLRDAGVLVALDDAGIALSNLDRMLDLRPDVVKLDRRWVGDGDARTRRLNGLVRSTLHSLCRETGAAVVIEGVETPAQLAALAPLGPCRLQGYLFSAPVPANTFVEGWGAGGDALDGPAPVAPPRAA